MTKEILYDVKDATHLALDHGERFRGWYMSHKFLRREELPLYYEEKGEGIRRKFSVFSYNIRFVMPSKVEFVGGLISYSESERNLGVFRFPVDEEGNFVSPLSKIKLEELKDKALKLSDEELEEMMKGKRVLTFNAFKITQYGFDFPRITDDEFEAVEAMAGKEISDRMRSDYLEGLHKKIEEVKEKISSQPNYLLILQNVLDKRWKNLDELSIATNEIIHI